VANDDKIVAQIVGEAWADDAFKRRLLANPTEVMREYGLDIPPGMRVVMHENTADTRHVVLPAKPDAFEARGNVLAAIRILTVPFALFLPRRGGGGKGGERKRPG
jgi:nitrile hydratase alpha subunit